jgi:hypothetical protein
MIMTPDERLELEACLRRVSEILYNNSDTDSLETLADIEITVRNQVLEHVSPKIAFFLSPKKLKPKGEKPELSKAVSAN